jgi:hypothetical protein
MQPAIKNKNLVFQRVKFFATQHQNGTEIAQVNASIIIFAPY